MVIIIGKFEVLIDEEDYEKVMQYNWRDARKKNPYFICVRNINKKQTRIWLHRVIMDVQGLNWKKTIVDHINGNTLDNRKSNLRIATPGQSCYNTRKFSNNTTGYKGVDFKRNIKKYRARISVDKKRIELGYFQTAEEAAKCYDKAALLYHKEFAVLNFPTD